ncbi:cob(I)yrinic acid a,c-diamide adenosyltransferase [Aliiglaciecola litoralis]|uniref:Corrinoid adenosyltransferase n=1 Tax=Aliiglaciecola litoralis TaxID=582857 RepID=A0ABP3WZ08_9ALTE
MKIYTKSGDKGHTQIFAKEMVRMQKDADVLECYGTLDELNAQIGMLLTQQSDPIIQQHEALLLSVQKNLFQIGFAISAQTQLQPADLEDLERCIDKLQDSLPAQTHFILPGGHPVAALLHICRTIARRAERRMVALIKDYPVPDLCLSYLNRLSDFLFVLARSVNHHHQVQESQV